MKKNIEEFAQNAREKTAARASKNRRDATDETPTIPTTMTMTTSSLPFTCDESSLCGSDIEHIVASKKRSESPNALLTVTEVHYFRNKTSDDDDDDDDDESSVALVSIVASEPLKARGDGDMIGTTRFTVSKLLSSALDGAEEGRIACTFTPEGREKASFCSLSENAKKYITECIFKPFSEDNENLFRIDGTCEIFCPMNGTNTGWHRDGFQSGCYIGHALFEEEREADDIDAAPADAAWFEFALIKQNVKDTSEDDVQLDFCDSDHLLVKPSNFVAFTSRNAVSIFEDSKIYHRSPRVKSCWDSMERGARKIARFDFVGRDAENNVLLWKMKKNETSRRETAAPTSAASAVAQNASRLCALRRHLLCEQREERAEEKDKDAIDVRFARYVNESSRPR
jgi:hypothetical protein